MKAINPVQIPKIEDPVLFASKRAWHMLKVGGHLNPSMIQEWNKFYRGQAFPITKGDSVGFRLVRNR